MKKIAIFNHKGGVSKTTTAFHLGWMLANMGKKVLFVDADSQCNLTMMFMGYSKYDEFLLSDDKNNIKEALEPAFKAKPRLIDSIECLQILPDSKYIEANLLNKELKSLNRELDKYCIGQVSNFNRFIADSNKKSVPVYELNTSDVNYSGQKKTLTWFKALFEMMSKKIILLSND